MDNDAPVQESHEWKFVEAFVMKDRQERYFEILRKDNRRKWQKEMDGRMWAFLNPKFVLYCRPKIFLDHLLIWYPQIFHMKTCYVMDYHDNIDRCIMKTNDFIEYTNEKGFISYICSFVPGVLAVYYSEEMWSTALCYRMPGYHGYLAQHPMFREIAEK